MPFDRSKYPANWDEFSSHIRYQRAKEQCECEGECGLHSHPKRRCLEMNAEEARFAKGRVVLTTAHLCDCDPPCVIDTHVKAMCNRCHLRLDSKLHQRNARKTRHGRKAASDLFQ